MYEYGALRPPTAREMDDRMVVLEVIVVSWICGSGFHDCGTEGYARTSTEFAWSVAELAQFCQDNEIPYGARLHAFDANGGLLLDWSHLTLCECREWFAGSSGDHVETDHHRAIMAAREWRPSEERMTLLRTILSGAGSGI